MLRRGEIRVCGKRVKPTYRLLENDILRLPPMYLAIPKKTIAHGRYLSTILDEDNNFLVVDKPSGVAVHGGTRLAFGLVENLRIARPDLDYLELAHRLDRDTSGCLLLAKKMSVLRQLHALFRENKIYKRYIALVFGKVPNKLRCINTPLRRRSSPTSTNTTHGPSMITDSDGKASETQIVLKKHITIGDTVYSLIDALPRTGRMHQIRAHLALSGYPVAGDSKYGLNEINAELEARGLKRLFLHARELGFTTDDERRHHWCASVPAVLSKFLLGFTEYQVE